MQATHRRVLAGWGLTVALASAAHAQSDVVSSGPAHVAVTIYRAPGRAPEAGFQAGWLGGYALISEEREIDLPAGSATVRFEGVAAGMLAETAIVSGLPEGVVEKNLDADLLSPRTLYARAFGRPVVLRRRHPGSGQVEEVPAIIRSGPDGAAVVQTRDGFEAVDCGGLRDSIAWQGLPPGLTSRPTLSVTTRTERAQRVKVRLSYLAWGFDWQAHYVLALAPGARQATMTAWLTLASGDDTAFPQAMTSVTAGQPHFDEIRPDEAQDGTLDFQCQARRAFPPPLAMAMATAPMMDIVVTGSRRMVKADYAAKAENLGDLHLYRIPVATTVAAHGQKQVALLTERRIRLALVHTATIAPDAEREADVTLRLRNRREDGLGLALPAGGISVVQPLKGSAIPAGEGNISDKAEGETVEVAVGTAPTVRVVSVATPTPTPTPAGQGDQRVRATVTNANRWPVRFEGRLVVEAGASVTGSSARLTRKDGLPLWSTMVPAQGRMVLTYTLRTARP